MVFPICFYVLFCSSKFIYFYLFFLAFTWINKLVTRQRHWIGDDEFFIYFYFQSELTDKREKMEKKKL